MLITFIKIEIIQRLWKDRWMIVVFIIISIFGITKPFQIFVFFLIIRQIQLCWFGVFLELRFDSKINGFVIILIIFDLWHILIESMLILINLLFVKLFWR